MGRLNIFLPLFFWSSGSQAGKKSNKTILFYDFIKTSEKPLLACVRCEVLIQRDEKIKTEIF